MANRNIVSTADIRTNEETLYVDFGSEAGYDDPTEVGIQMSNRNGNNLPYGTFKLVELAEALNAIPGFTASFDPPVPFPTKPGTMLVTYKDVDGEPTDVVRFFRIARGWTNDTDRDPWLRNDKEMANWLGQTKRGFNVVPTQD